MQNVYHSYRHSKGLAVKCVIYNTVSNYVVPCNSSSQYFVFFYTFTKQLKFPACTCESLNFCRSYFTRFCQSNCFDFRWFYRLFLFVCCISM